MTNRLARVVRKLRTVAEGIADRDLLNQYVRDRDEAAFEVLVRRHGPMVLGVCRRVLRNQADAQDAFQASFLVLVRKAHCIRSAENLGNWLYGVAHRAALEARRAMVRRRMKESKVLQRAETSVAGSDLLEVLDQELARLPEKYRAPIILSDLQGKTRCETAHELGIAEGTVASRIARGRVMLAKRLVRHGLAPSVGTLAVAFSPAAVSASLVSKTVAASLTTTASGVVAILAQGVMKTMFLNRLRNTLVVALILALLYYGLGSYAGSSNASGQSGPTKKDAATTTNRDTLQGHWRIVAAQVEGKPAPDVKGLSCLIIRDRLLVKHKNTEHVSRFQVDPSSCPKTIDLIDRDGKVTDRGIYKLEGDTLFICTHPEQRPKEFTIRMDDKATELLSLQRATEAVDTGLAAMAAGMMAVDTAVQDIQKVMTTLRQKTHDRDTEIKALEEIERAVQKMRDELRSRDD